MNRDTIYSAHPRGRKMNFNVNVPRTKHLPLSNGTVVRAMDYGTYMEVFPFDDNPEVFITICREVKGKPVRCHWPTMDEATCQQAVQFSYALQSAAGLCIGWAFEAEYKRVHAQPSV